MTTGSLHHCRLPVYYLFKNWFTSIYLHKEPAKLTLKVGSQDAFAYRFTNLLHRTIYNGEIRPSTEELDGGRFWTLDEIRAAIGQNTLTPNFESEFQRFFL